MEYRSHKQLLFKEMSAKVQKDAVKAGRREQE